MQLDFDTLASRHRRELIAHCYRMLGSLAEAEDMVQETLLKAWKAQAAFEGRASPRTWLYKIATNACIDRKRAPRLLPQMRFVEADPEAPLADPVGEHIDPCPEPVWTATPQPADARITARESVTLAFMAALEQLPPLQRAVLLLRDVLDFSAQETAEILDKSPQAIESALERARASTEHRRPAESNSKRELLQRYIAAWEKKDSSALVALLREDATLTMPPLPTWFCGREKIQVFLRGLMASLGEIRVREIAIAGGVGVMTFINGEPTSVSALEIDGDSISAIDTNLTPQIVRAFVG